MVIKVVTDSTSDLPQALADELGITIIPLYVLFGNETYRDRVAISEDEFYTRLLADPVHPTTSQPSPQDFIEIYDKLGKEADGIISVHISSKLSGTCSSALQAKEMAQARCPIEVVDSNNVSMGLGLVAVRASELVSSGKDFKQVVEETRLAVSTIGVWAMFDTLKYLAKGGRVGKAKALMGSALNIKPILAVKNGEMVPVTKARSRDKGVDILLDIAGKFKRIDDLAVMHTTTPDEAFDLADHMGELFERDRIKIARLGPALGVHAGPGTLGFAIRGS